jgi:hypothetical protein
MADRGRDLKFSILSDLDQFDTDKPAKGLEDLADSAQDAGKRLDELDDKARDTRLDRLGDDAHDAKRDLDNLGDQAKTTARRMDDAFDKIADSSRASLRRKVGEDVDHAKGKLKEAGQEGQDTAREMFASFTDVSSVGDAAQEISANVGGLFGPIGLAIGGALSAGFAIFNRNADKIKQTGKDIADALIESKGRLDEAFIQDKIKGFVEDGSIQKLAQQAEDAQVPVRDFLRAVAGDPDAIGRVNTALDVNRSKLGEQVAGNINAADAIDTFNRRQDAVRGALGETSSALASGRSDYDLYKAAVEQPVNPRIQTSKMLADANRAYAQAHAALSKDIVIPTRLEDLTYDMRLRIAKAQAYADRHPVTIRTNTGAGGRPIRDVP